MRLKHFLTEHILDESQMYVKQKDLPVWVTRLLKTHKIGKDVLVTIDQEVNISPVVHDANVKYLYLYDNGKTKQIVLSGGQSINDSDVEFRLKKGFKQRLSPSQMILACNTYPKSAHFYVHPNAMTPLIQNAEPEDLSKEEILFLRITQGLKSFARKDECKRYGLDYDTLKNKLINKSYLNKNGSINTKGKNILTNHKGDIMSLARELGIKDKRFG